MTTKDENGGLIGILGSLPIPCRNSKCLDYMDGKHITDRGCNGLCPNYCVETIKDYLQKELSN